MKVFLLISIYFLISFKTQFTKALVLTEEIFQENVSDTLFVRKSIDINRIRSSSNRFHVIKFSDGVFEIPELVLSYPIKIVGMGRNKTILRPRKSSGLKIMLSTSSNLIVEDLTFDGKQYAAYGLNSKHNLVVKNCTFKNFMGNRRMSGIAIRHTVPNRNLTVINTVFSNITGEEDGIEGNSVGANRAIYTSSGQTIIDSCTFSNILGNEDTDVIHVESRAMKGDKWRESTNVNITNCTFNEFGKRALKIVGSRNIISGNTFVSLKSSSYVVIGIFGSKNIVRNNTFQGSVSLALVSISEGKENAVVDNEANVELLNNAHLFYSKNSSNSNIKGNKFVIRNGSKTKLIRSPASGIQKEFNGIEHRNKFSFK